MAKPKPTLKTAPKSKAPQKKADIFSRKNYMLTGIAALVICIGFILMYSKPGNDIYSFRKITLAPIVVLIGFAIGGYAIFYRDKDQDNTEK